MKKHLTAEAEQWCRERIGQHNDNLKLWESGYLNATEPEQEEREITVCQLRAARDELIELLGRFCGPQSVADEHRLRSMTLDEAMKRAVNVPEESQ